MAEPDLVPGLRIRAVMGALDGIERTLASCPGCDGVHRVLADLAAVTAGHDGHARRLRAAGDRRRVQEAERHEAIAGTLRDVRERLARALQQWGQA